MRLDTGEFFGEKNRVSAQSGLELTVSSYEPLQEQPWHSHANPTFFISTRGDHIDCSPKAGRQQCPLSITFHPTVTPHRSITGPGGLHGVNIEVTPDWLAEFQMEEGEFGEQRILSGGVCTRPILRLLKNAFLPSTLDETESLVLDCLELFLREEAVGETATWVSRAEEFLLANFRQSISLKDVAKEVGVHPVHVARTFRRIYGNSICEIIRNERIRCCAEEILDGESIGLAALRAGFADQFHLSRSFRRETGFALKELKRIRRRIA